MSIREDLAEQYGEDLLFLEEEFFDKAIVGVVHQFNNTVVCYDKNMVIELLSVENEMSEEDALDYFYYNTIGAYVGEKTPAFLELL
jgi:hypothetical protein